ncbi:MAG: hypothetical protein AAGF46_02650 [Pseudomonadota bacterium]
MLKGARRIWMLALVPNHRHGRLISAVVILLLGTSVYALADYLRSLPSASNRGFLSWSVAMFFVTAVAYIVPVFHYISQRTRQSLYQLAPYLPQSTDIDALTTEVERRTVGWTFRVTLVAVALWLIQSRLLAGSWLLMWERTLGGFVNIAMDWGPLPVWLTMCTSMSALVHNALLFRRLVRQLDVRILEPESFMPVGTMAVTSTLVVLGALALLSVMWLGGPLSWWTTLPALAFFSPLIAMLLLLPVLPLHRRLREQRLAAIQAAQAEVTRVHAPDAGASVAERAAALSLRREVARLPAWPFDVPAIIRFISYAVIVPLTWAGAALIEILVNAIVA